VTSVHLYELKLRFQERWDKPIWDAKPGEGNFTLDESPWFGGIAEFVVFSVGHVQKTEAGWVPLRKSQPVERWCTESPQRNSYFFCYWVPYQTPPPTAVRVGTRKEGRETWSLTRDGLLRYAQMTQGDSPVDHTYDFGSSIETLLDLNTGVYSTVAHTHLRGTYTKRIPEGVELWRGTTLSGRVELIPQTCSASVQKASSLGSLKVPREEEAHPVSICVARAKANELPASYEFIINPRALTSPDGCVVAHEGPMPRRGSATSVAPER
jgi:hypothetical protein